ncbi:hypothetical protein Salat_2417500 [Sesamum alatum]|uniref:Uncharacterized protein n=1 Tax=Sesamum alatum TaxID=300844 RepID=A0AAE1XYR5_9LAMI|nr:hypothetical protein Salat_2417500 [Sesamum alatum]
MTCCPGSSCSLSSFVGRLLVLSKSLVVDTMLQDLMMVVMMMMQQALKGHVLCWAMVEMKKLVTWGLVVILSSCLLLLEQQVGMNFPWPSFSYQLVVLEEHQAPLGSFLLV